MRLKQKRTKKNEKAITLIALVVTIVVLLILAGISLNSVVGENGILKSSKKSKVESEISKEKEIVDISVSAVKTSKKGRGDFSTITVLELQNELDNLIGQNMTQVFGMENLIVLFVDSNRTYEVNNNGKIELDETIEVIDKTPGVLEGNGNENNPYLIESIEDLVMFSKNIENGNNYEGKFIKLTVTLNFNSPKSYVNANKRYEEFGDLNGINDIETIFSEMTSRDGAGFIPIGTTNSFKGNFDGDNNYIKNLYINRDLTYVGLFSKVQNATIQNLSVTGEIHGEIVGGISAYTYEGTIRNCNNYVSLFGTNEVYGITSSRRYSGEMLIENCNNYSNIECEATKCYGIGYTGTIKNCNNYGNIFSEYSANISGICSSGTITNCNNYGSIKIITDKKGAYVRGISDVYGKVYNCNNYGELYVEVKSGESTSSELEVSGIGSAYARNCINYGNITAIGGEIYSGGITGEIDSVRLGKATLYIENCCNFGNITNRMNVMNNRSTIECGGIIGYSACNLNIYNNCNYGKITSESSIEKYVRIGGIAGWLSSTSGGSYQLSPNLKNCINVGNINIIENVGGMNVHGVCVSTQFFEDNVYNIADVNVLGEITSNKDEITIEQMKDILNNYVDEQNNTIEGEVQKLCKWKIENINNRKSLIIDNN